MKQRLVIYTHEGKTLKFDDVKNVNFKSDTLYFEMEGYAGDTSKNFFRDIAGYSHYTSKEDIMNETYQERIYKAIEKEADKLLKVNNND